MPLLPFGFDRATLQRVKQRLEDEVGSRIDRVKQRLVGPTVGPGKGPGAEPGLGPQGPARGEAEVLLRLRRAVNAKPPTMVRGLYKRADANAPSWRYLQPYCLRRNRVKDDPSAVMLFAACEADGWKIEAFRLDRFSDVQNTDLPYAVSQPYPVEVETF